MQMDVNSVSVTPFKEDFPGGVKETEDTEMHGLKDAVEIAGEGMVDGGMGNPRRVRRHSHCPH